MKEQIGGERLFFNLVSICCKKKIRVIRNVRWVLLKNEIRFEYEFEEIGLIQEILVTAMIKLTGFTMKNDIQAKRPRFFLKPF